MAEGGDSTEDPQEFFSGVFACIRVTSGEGRELSKQKSEL